MENFNWREKLDQFKYPLGLAVVGIVLIIGGIVASGLNKQPQAKSFPKESLVENQGVIVVDVSGAVQKPGVYKLKVGSRIEEALVAAGGISDTANKEFIAKYLNMAQKLVDGSKVYVPLAGENGANSQAGVVAGASIQTKVNINSASQSELEALPGIGPVTASKIISDRPYQAVEELLNKKVISKAVFEKIKDQLVLY